MYGEDRQRASHGRVVAVLRDKDGAEYVGSVELLDGGPVLPMVVFTRGRAYTMAGTHAHGAVTYAETSSTHAWEFGPPQCSARESGGFRCSAPANHPPGEHKFDETPVLATDRCQRCARTRAEAREMRPHDDWCDKGSMYQDHAFVPAERYCEGAWFDR